MEVNKYGSDYQLALNGLVSKRMFGPLSIRIFILEFSVGDSHLTWTTYQYCQYFLSLIFFNL